MFGGLISYQGVVRRLEHGALGGLDLAVECASVAAEQPQPKDSIAIDGACLTVTRVTGSVVAFEVVPESLACTTLAARRLGDTVNVEYSLRMGERMGGHFVYGHVDAALPVLARTREGQGERIRIARSQALAPMIVQKAFIAVDGVSLTVAAVGAGWFEIALIPETLARTTLGQRPVGTSVNIEVDPLARYAYASLIAQREADRA